jgi:hypothetical protein
MHPVLASLAGANGPNPGNPGKRSAGAKNAGACGGSLRVFEQFVWLGVGSGKAAWSRPAHQPSSGCYATGNAQHWALVSRHAMADNR